MRYGSATGSSKAGSGKGRRLPALPPGLTGLLAALALVAGCAGNGKAPDEGEKRVLLMTRKGESAIQVTESELDGSQIVRVKTTFQGKENVIVLNIDQPVYEVEIPLMLEQLSTGTAASPQRGPEGQFQDLLIAQWLQKAQQAMLAGDYNGALRQVDTVLQVQPNHMQGHTMKGSIYYALGNYQLANDEWEYVLSLDPTNKEVLEFQEFLKKRSSEAPPPLPGAPQAPAAAQPPAPGGTGTTQGAAQ